MTDYRFIRKIAKMYRDMHPDYSIRKAVFKAYEAYEFYRETEIKIMDEHYEKGYR